MFWLPARYTVVAKQQLFRLLHGLRKMQLQPGPPFAPPAQV